MASMTHIDSEDDIKRRLQVVFTRRMEERRIFMKELQDIRAQTYKRMYKIIRKSIGPKWYQVLSQNQRDALDSLAFSVYQDLLEGRPVRVLAIMRTLGISPRPSRLELLNCMYVGRHDPKQVLANLFLSMTGHNYNDKLPKYTLNGRILLSSIYYMGLEKLKSFLRQRFRPDPPPPPPPKKPKPKPGPALKSPYLQESVAPMYTPKALKRRPVLSLPDDLESLNEPYVETPPVAMPPPPPPPPPPPKKRIPVSYCDQIAGYSKIQPYRSRSKLSVIKKAPANVRKIRASKLCLAVQQKKVYGLGESFKRPKKKGKKPVPPSTGYENTQYMIQGIHIYNGRPYYVLSTVVIVKSDGEIIHGGHKYLNGEYIRIHNGYKAHQAPADQALCDCDKVYSNAVYKYLKKTKCRCGHLYDYGHEEGTLSADEPPYFIKPNKRSGFEFNYANIFEMDPRMATVQKEFKRIWETESFIHEETDEEDVDPEKNKKKKKIVRKSSKTCLGPKPRVTDYLRCALRSFRREDLSARLPDLHLAPELVEWMRYRIHGPYTKKQKKVMEVKSTTYWSYLKSFQKMGLGVRLSDFDPDFNKMNTWKNKTVLNDKFVRHVNKFKVQLYRVHADFNNLLWATMYQAQFPDKKFREIYFSYLVSTAADVNLMHPYNQIDTLERTTKINKRRMNCLEKYTQEHID